MAGNKRIVMTFTRFGKAADAAGQSQRIEVLVPPGEQLVRVCLMADVPDKSVVGIVEDSMQSNRQLNRSERGCQMPAIVGDDFEDPLTQLFTQLCQLNKRKVF